jgi:hypothetical protein
VVGPVDCRGDQHDARRAVGLPENATTVRVQDGKTLTTDGPFVELKRRSAASTSWRPTT